MSTRDRILREGLDLMSTAGVSGMTLGTLAERANMSKSGLFAHFGSKEDMQLGVLLQMEAAAEQTIVAPAMLVSEGLQRLKAVLDNWFGWSTKAGLVGGCPAAAGVFEFDDVEGPVRNRLLEIDRQWKEFLSALVTRTVEKKEFRADLDVEQLVWELGGIYLSHHVSRRFSRDPQADMRARRAIDKLLESALARRKRSKA